MPAKNHRTVDRVTQLLEFAATRAQGATLTEMARALNAPVSSIQGLVNGLVASGYLTEEDKKYFLGPGPYILTLRANGMPARTVSHDDLVALHERTGCSVLLGVKMGQHVVYIDEVGESPHLVYLARSRMRRPMLETVAGRCILAHLPPNELHEYLESQPDTDLVDQYLSDLPDIRRTGIAINLESKFSKGTVIGSIVRDSSNRPIAAVVMGDDAERVAPRVDEFVEVIRDATATWSTRGIATTDGAR